MEPKKTELAEALHPYLLSQEKKELDALVQAVTSKKFKSQDVMELTGLTYRQLNSWDNDHDILNTERVSKEGWRSFKASEVLTLMLCTDLQNQFGISFDKLKWVKQRLYKNSWVDLDHSIRLIRQFDGDPHLITDLNNYLSIFPKSIINQAVKDNKLGDMPLPFTNFLVLKVSPSIYRIVTHVFDGQCPLEPDQVKSQQVKEFLDDLESLSKLKSNERKVVSEMRKDGFKTIVVTLRDKKVIKIDLEEELQVDTTNKNDWNKIHEALKANAFQTVQITKRNDEVVRLTRRYRAKTD